MATQRPTLDQTDMSMEEMRREPRPEVREPSGLAIGFIAFAAAMMAIVGGLHIIAGIAALIEDQFFVIGREYVYEFDVTTWGWIHLIAGIVVFVASFGLFTGRLWARTVGVLVAVASLILNFMYLPYYPVWSVVMISVAILVIWALTVHGRDIARESW